MKLYELEIKGKTKQTKHLRAKNLNEAQAKAVRGILKRTCNYP